MFQEKLLSPGGRDDFLVLGTGPFGGKYGSTGTSRRKAPNPGQLEGEEVRVSRRLGFRRPGPLG